MTVVSLAKRIEEVFVPGPQRADACSPHDSPALQLLQRVRDEAHRFAIEHHRGRRDRAMTRSILDELPGIGPARKRSLLAHFGSPERFLAASREELEAVPGLPGKVARDVHAYVHKVDDRSARCQDFVVITGFSGAGKSQAMATFEDAGYFCVDNLPPEMIGSLADLFDHEGSKVERAAVASDMRGGEYFDGLVKVLDDLERRGVPLPAALPRGLRGRADQPLQGDPPPPSARGRGLGRGGDPPGARGCSAPLRERADVSIDTSDLSAARLRKVVADKMLARDGSASSRSRS